ncbi:MAG: VWA domain-containing protein [Deltaproteobacteria bacterium]|nr:VWA domain-containing protein [Deltaproteobacteria bacterium]
MRHKRYSRWTHARTWPEPNSGELAGRLFEELSHFLNWGLSTQEALDWLMRQGFELPAQGTRVLGTDELLQKLRRVRRETFHSHNLKKSLEIPQREIQAIVELETATCRQELGWGNPAFHQREDTLRTLPPQPSQALAVLEKYHHAPGFLDDEARRRFLALRERAEDLGRVEDFVSRFDHQFQGPDSLDYPETRTLMNQFGQMAQLMEALRSGDFRQVTLEGLEPWLGEEEMQSLTLVLHFTRSMEEHGFLKTTPQGVRLTPAGFRRIGAKALEEIFRLGSHGSLGLHPHARQGISRPVAGPTRPYEFGMPFHMDYSQTLKNALPHNPRGKKIHLSAQDFEVFDQEEDTRATTVLMLDMSWSMSREGRFPAAKRVALALDHLIRTRYPRDDFYTIGFSTRARLLAPHELTDASWDPADPFTNLQEGLAMARRLMTRHQRANRQIIIITDGQPTATHVGGQTNAQWPGFMGSIPPDILKDTLQEVTACTREGITLNTFMLDDNPVLTRFVEDITRVNRGRAFYSLPANLGQYLLVDYIQHRRKKIG